MIKEALARNEAAGIPTGLYSEVQGNPIGKNVEDGVKVYKAGGHDGVIAFGGGSALDAAKAVALMVGQTRPIWDFEDIGDWWTRGQRRRHRADHRRADHIGHRIGSGPCLGHHRREHAYEEDHLPSEDATRDRDRRSGADRRPAAAHHRGDRHGCAVALPGSLLRPGLPSAGGRHRAEGMRLVAETFPRR